MVKKLSDLYLEARRAIMTREDAQTASTLARELVAYAAQVEPHAVITRGELYAGDKACQTLSECVERVLKQEPLAYILGEWEFYGLKLYVDPNVLIPRDDTCAVTQLAIHKALFLGASPRILDLCTGSGCIGLAIADRVKDAKVTLADVSPQALAVAKKNVTTHKLGGRVSCVRADALAAPMPFLGKFDMIVSNPPYITTKEMGELDSSVKDYEPHLALHGGDDGLVFYRSIAQKYAAALKPGGYLCFEFGAGQGDDVCRILAENGYKVLERVNDFNDRERAVLAQLREE
ncbi:MAG: peptide chain release factor N(5)-glutamine methyltransferase [Ruminococcaceae bacterium]|nr:peptide chain release factor N(5)-glutamine methyltransferase [Oscillospiraceae bacterium]